MELAAAGLHEQPFRTHGKSLVYVPYAGQRAAERFLKDTAAHAHGLGLLQGPRLSGKSTIIREFAEAVDQDTAIAVVDGAGLNTTTFLNSVLGQFGYELQFNSANELINMLRVFALQQAGIGKPPLLIIENTHAMNPSALRVLGELAGFRLRHRSALRMVLASDRSIEAIVTAPAMEAIGSRLTGNFFLDPMTADETREYLYAKLRSGGCASPAIVVPHDVCEQLHVYSGGWPGVVDRLALLALARAPDCPIRAEHLERPLLPSMLARMARDEALAQTESYAGPPRLILSLHGKTLKEIDMDSPRLLIGRSEHNDLCVNSKYISKHHALLLRHGNATLLMDLNSTNGTYVNSRRVSNHVLQHGDVISVGQHGVKFMDPRATTGDEIGRSGLEDTIVMKSLDDMRRFLARENTVSLAPEGMGSANAESGLGSTR